MIITMDRLQAEYGVNPQAVLHVGAHLGEEAEAYSRAGVRRVLWVEANPGLIPQLEVNVLRFPGQTCVEAVVSDTDGADATLHCCTFSMATSLLAPKEHLVIYPGMHYLHDLPVKTVTVDTLLSDLGVPHDAFDFLNIDIEGAELLAFEGMPKVLPFLKWVYLEVNTREMYEGCAMVDEVDAYLGGLGFERVVMEDEGWDHGFKDALYVRHGWERADA